MPFAVRGLGFLANRSDSRLMMQGSREMRCGRTFVRNGESNFNSEALARTPGFLCAAMGLREEFVRDWSRMPGFLGSRFLQKSNGVWIPLFLVLGIRPISWYLDPIL